MFSAPRNSFDAYRALEEKKIVLVKGGIASLGEEHGMPVFLQYIVSQYYAAAMKRDPLKLTDDDLSIMLIDEAAYVFNLQIPKILNECRKYGLGLVCATQQLHQIPVDVKSAVYSATAIKMAGPVGHDDAVQLGKEMYCGSDFIRSMKAVDRAHADFAIHVRGLTDKAIRLTVPYGTLENAPRRATADDKKITGEAIEATVPESSAVTTPGDAEHVRPVEDW